LAVSAWHGADLLNLADFDGNPQNAAGQRGCDPKLVQTARFCDKSSDLLISVATFANYIDRNRQKSITLCGLSGISSPGLIQLT